MLKLNYIPATARRAAPVASCRAVAGILFVFFYCLTVRAELDVEWIDANTIRVTGYGNGGDGTVVTNWMGCCTNCTLITPEELTSGMDRIISKCSDIEGLSHNLDIVASAGLDNVQSKIDEIGTFRRFNLPNAVNNSTWLPFTNYIFSASNAQTDLVKNNFPNLSNFSQTNLGRARSGSYNDGIYDYANSSVLPYLDSDVRGDYVLILDTNSQITQRVASISSVAEQYRNLSSCPCGDDSGGGGGGGCAWTQDQIDALFDYVDHIDQDQHRRFVQLTAISNNVSHLDERFDSYAKLVSGVLYNDSTITLDDGETWTNVYFSGESNGYYYDKSNILQRIELILFGMAYSPTNTFEDLAYSYTNSLDDTSVENVTNRFDDLSSSISNGFDSAYQDFQAHVNSLKSIDTMFVFWGQPGSASPFTLGQVPDLGGSGSPQYITVGNDFLGSEVPRFRMLCRYAFQLLWAVGFLFMIWEFYVRLFKYVVVFLKYVCEWLNECFAS